MPGPARRRASVEKQALKRKNEGLAQPCGTSREGQPCRPRPWASLEALPRAAKAGWVSKWPSASGFEDEPESPTDRDSKGGRAASDSRAPPFTTVGSIGSARGMSDSPRRAPACSFRVLDSESEPWPETDPAPRSWKVRRTALGLALFCLWCAPLVAQEGAEGRSRPIARDAHDREGAARTTWPRAEALSRHRPVQEAARPVYPDPAPARMTERLPQRRVARPRVAASNWRTCRAHEEGPARDSRTQPDPARG